MRREGDKILFDSEAQHGKFELALFQADGAKEIMGSILAAIGQARRDELEWWLALGEHIDKKTESVSYDWSKREVLVRKTTSPAGA